MVRVQYNIELPIITVLCCINTGSLVNPVKVMSKLPDGKDWLNSKLILHSATWASIYFVVAIISNCALLKVWVVVFKDKSVFIADKPWF